MIGLPQSALVLASSSPRRQTLLGLLGWPFSTSPAGVDETQRPGEQPVDYALRLAQDKAWIAAATADPGAVILAADTIVVDEGLVLGKPADADEAWRTLQQLRGRTHRVYTAITLRLPGADQPLVDLCETHVPMRRYSEDEIGAYIDSGDPFDKAGAYAIQHPVFRPVESLTGCYANVVGLPLCHLVRTLASAGLQPPADVAAACQEHLGYNCPVYQDVLDGGAHLHQEQDAQVQDE